MKDVGTASYVGSGAAQELSLPYFDPTAKMDPVPEDDHPM